MNKKGFTLVEVIVSLALLSLIGVAVGISLNKIFKNQEIKSYNEYVEKVKSSAILYANNTVDIINDLNSNYSYKVVTIKELVDKGYINKNLTNPETKEKINQDDSVRIYYNEDYEMIIDYPYTNQNDAYLFVTNYSTTYQSKEPEICYQGINTPSFQIVTPNGKPLNIKLVENKNIKAYLEDGSPCYDAEDAEHIKLNIDTSKIVTYKIRYEYTIDGTDVNKSTNKRIAERTLTIKPSKPTITEFNITYKNAINDNNFDSNDAKLNLQASDEKGLNLKYCLVATGINETPNVTSCNGTSDTIQENTWINENSNTIEKQNDDINIKDLFALAEKENKLKISVFVKNDFEEYNSMSNQKKEDGKEIIYIIRNKLTLIYSYGSKTPSYDNKEYNLKIGTNITDILKDAEVKNDLYAFEGWYTDKNGGGTSSDKYSKYPKIYDDLTFYAKWYEYCKEKVQVKEGSCSCTTKKKTIKYKDRYYDHTCPDEKVSCTPTNCSSGSGGSGCYEKPICTGAGYYGQEACNNFCPNTYYANNGWNGPGCYRTIC